MSHQPPARTAKLAELYFESLCNEAGAVCNRVADDQNGWDYLVEFQPPDADVPPDLRPPHLRCFVQIKSTISSVNSCFVKLSNALRFAKDSAPCFIVLAKFRKGEREPYAVFLRHFWIATIAETLRASREAHVLESRLNHLRFPVKFDPSEQQNASTISAIQEEITRVGVDYSGQKKILSDALGYEDGKAMSGKFSLEEGVTITQFVDLNLGLIESLPIKNFQVTDARFGTPTTLREIISGTIKVEPKPIDHCVIVIRNPISLSEVSWPGHIFSPGLPNLPLEEQKLRVSSGNLQIILYREGRSDFSLEKINGKKMTAQEVSRNLSTRAILDEGNLELEIWTRGRIITSSTLALDATENNQGWWLELSRAFSSLIGIVPIERLPDDFITDLETLISEKAELEKFARHLHGDTEIISLSLDTVNNRTKLLGATQIILPLAFDLSGFSFVVAVQRRITKIELVDDGLKIHADNGRIVRGAIIKGATENHLDYISQETKWAEKKANASAGTVISIRPS